MTTWNDGIPDTAPPMVPPVMRGPLLLGLPSGHTESLTYEQAETLHKELGQNLARGMRLRGSSPDNAGPDLGGTPVAMRAAA